MTRFRRRREKAAREDAGAEGEQYGRTGPRGTEDHRAAAGAPERGVAGARPSGDVAVVYAGVSPGGAPARGAMIEDMDGNRFLDYTAGIAVTSAGHSHPRVVAAIRKQANRLIHMSGTDFYYTPQVRLAERLAAIAPGPEPKRVFFTNSGAEAIEAALEAVAAAHRPQPRPGVHERLPWADLRRHVALRVEAHAAPRLLPVGPRDPPRALRRPGERPRHPADDLPARGAGGDLRRADPGGGGLHRPAARVPARAAPALRRASRAPGLRRGAERDRPDGQDVRVGALGGRRRHRLPGQGDRQRPPAGCDRRAGVGDGLAQRQPRLDVRRQPGRLRRGAGDAPPDRGQVPRQRHPAGPRVDRRPTGDGRIASPSSARCGARG